MGQEEPGPGSMCQRLRVAVCNKGDVNLLRDAGPLTAATVVRARPSLTGTYLIRDHILGTLQCCVWIGTQHWTPEGYTNQLLRWINWSEHDSMCWAARQPVGCPHQQVVNCMSSVQDAQTCQLVLIQIPSYVPRRLKPDLGCATLLSA